MEKEENYKVPFLDVLVENSHPDFLVTLVFRKKSYMGVLTNFFSVLHSFLTKLVSFVH